jgi:hypothetical protein
MKDAVQQAGWRIHRSLREIASLVLLCLTPLAARAQFTFTTNNGAITITGYTGSGGNVIIPAATNGYPVTAIGDGAFSYKTSLTGISIPGSITNIGARAFWGCHGLTSVTISNNVANIGRYAFTACSSMTNITVASGNPNYASADGVLFDKGMTLLIQYPGGRAGSYMIPRGVTRIGDSAFASCDHLAEVTIPSGVTNIGNNAFIFCNWLTSVTIPSSVASIDSYAFAKCSGLTNISVASGNANYASADGVLFDKGMTLLIQCPGGRAGSYAIPGGVTRINGSAFEQCSGLTNVAIPNSITHIGSQAFSDCSSLSSVAIPNSVTNIGWGAFYGCSSLSSVAIPSSVASMDGEPFLDCSSLTNISVASSNANYASADGVLFNKGMTLLIQYPGGKVGSYAIPGSVTRIGDSAFELCCLTEVTIPNSVTSIEWSAFCSCSSLTSVTIPASVTNMGGFAFAWCENLHQAFFQGNAPGVDGGDGSLDNTVFNGQSGSAYYLPGSTGWEAFYGGWPTALWNPQMQKASPGFGVHSNCFGFDLTGTASIPIVVEASTNLDGVWTPLMNGVLTNGAIHFSDPQWTNHPSRFYRIRSP